MSDFTAIEIAILPLAYEYVPAVYRRILFALNDGPCNVDTLVERTHTAKASVQDAIKVLRTHKVIRICGWERRSRGPHDPTYELWTDKRRSDAHRLKPLTSAEKSQRWRKKVDYAATRPDRQKEHRLTMLGQLIYANKAAETRGKS